MISRSARHQILDSALRASDSIRNSLARRFARIIAFSKPKLSLANTTDEILIITPPSLFPGEQLMTWPKRCFRVSVHTWDRRRSFNYLQSASAVSRWAIDDINQKDLDPYNLINTKKSFSQREGQPRKPENKFSHNSPHDDSAENRTISDDLGLGLRLGLGK